MDSDAGAIQPDEDGLGLHAGHAEADELREPVFESGPDHGHALNRQCAVDDSGNLSPCGCSLRRHRTGLTACQRSRRAAEGQQRGECFEPGPAPPFLSPADEQRIEPDPASHDQRSSSGHAPELVRV